MLPVLFVDVSPVPTQCLARGAPWSVGGAGSPGCGDIGARLSIGATSQLLGSFSLVLGIGPRALWEAVSHVALIVSAAPSRFLKVRHGVCLPGHWWC